MLAAGYAPRYSEGAWNAEEMKTITDVLERMLHQHEPFPAVVMDRYWNVLMTNDSTPRFLDSFTELAVKESPLNILHLMFDPERMRPFIANWESVAGRLFERVYRESVGRVIDEKTKELLAALQAYPGVKAEWKSPKAPATGPTLPMIPIGFVRGKKVLNYFSMVTTVGTPQTIAAQELRLECMYPVDKETEMEALMHDEEVISFIRKQAAGARFVFSVCTGALLCGAAGLLQGKRATTHWTAMEVLPYFGAKPTNERVVIDGKLISAGGVTSGIDGSLVVVSLLRGEAVAQELQLYMAYDPHPPFQSGSPSSAPASILSAVTQRAKPITEQRLETARAYQRLMKI